ncbi:DNA-binding anti-repressor SinI [Metabacillus sp. KIGAM252]|uniref:DNA-binding anti-repressor SinI n=1 Tax=Metabacillus flavus TaxID=2823519 RepID=A0ABS5LFW8_9BACI|nr:DNA-binding anti-repressor SinI [Metabacillus flavus]MBS2969630.1 DNA-binding anti-repressor SinI [Metabacillus flavus]
MMITEKNMVSEEEWIELLIEARKLGMTPDDVRTFLFKGELVTSQ